MRLSQKIKYPFQHNSDIHGKAKAIHEWPHSQGDAFPIVGTYFSGMA
jgi:hypothetical protein